MINSSNKEIDDLIVSAKLSKEQGDLPSTFKYLKKILELDPNNKRALNNIGNVFKEMKNFEEAIKYYLKVINLNPDYKIAKINLAILYHDLGKLEEAKKIYKKLINLDKYNFAIHFNLSRIDFTHFDENMINFIEQAVENENVNYYNKASGYFILAKDQQIKKNYEKEIDFLNRVMNIYKKCSKKSL